MTEKVFGPEAEEHFYNAVDEMITTDIWKTHFANEIKVEELPDCPIGADGIMIDKGIESELKSQVLEAMATSKAIAKVPSDTGYKAYPINVEAFPSLSDRAGLYGRTIKAVPEVLNVGLEINEDKGQALIRDGMLSADHSGKYVILEQNRLLNIFKDELSKLNLDEKFEFARLTVSFTDCIYSVKTKTPPKSSRGLNTRFAVRFTTSDTSKSGANVGCGILFMQNGRQYILPFGKVIKLKHDGDANFTQFRQNCTLLLSLLREQEQKLEELSKREIKHPEDCFANLVNNQNLPKTEAKEILDDFLIRCGATVTALDVFLNLSNIIGLVEEKGNYDKALDVQENIARIAFFDNAMWNKMDSKNLF